VERQFVVQLENRPGELAAVARALACRGINITHISCAGAGSVASCSLVTDDEERTREALHELGHAFIEGTTLNVDVPDRPGGLAQIVERFAAAGVNVLGTLIVGRKEGIVKMTFAVNDLDRARAALAEAEPAGVA
jgi:hypothetical protein